MGNHWGKSILTVAFMALVGVGLGGCIAVGSSSNENRPTTGQELIDLKSALDRGAITQQEYDKKKAEILARQK